MDVPRNEKPEKLTEKSTQESDSIDKELQDILAQTESIKKGVGKIFRGIDHCITKKKKLDQMPIKNKLLTLLFVMLFSTLSAQSNVNISIVDAVSSLGIENATVTLNAISLETDANGDVTFTNVTDGSYTYSVSALCYIGTDGDIMVSGADVSQSVSLDSQVNAPVFVSVSSHPVIGAWVDGNINLTDGVNSYNADVTEFDNILADVAFGTYNYTFTPAGGCFPSVTGMLTVDCDAIEAQSGNVFFPILADQPEITIDITVAQEDTLLTANATGATIGYQWVDCNNGNAEIPGETNQTFISATSGSFAVIITDSICGRSETSVCFDITPTGSDIGLINNDIEFSVFPNPVKERLTVSIERLYPEVRFELYSLTGQLIRKEIQLNVTDFQVNVSELVSGTYVVKLTADSKVRTALIFKR
jgi:hypothetical protein